MIALNEYIAERLDEVAQLLAEQGASRLRVEGYQRAGASLRRLDRPVADIFKQGGYAGLCKLPAVGKSIALSITELLQHGRLAMLDRLRGEHDPVALLRTVPGIGASFARLLHEDLGIENLTDLEAAAHDGRLEKLPGLGAKRLTAIRDTLAHRLDRIRLPSGPGPHPPVAEILDVDAEYRRAVAADTLKKIAPRRFNPTRSTWLPVMHAARGDRHYTALFANTARAHELGKTRDWVVLYYDGYDGERQCTVITSEFGHLKGLRVIRGREDECRMHYDESRPAGGSVDANAS